MASRRVKILELLAEGGSVTLVGWEQNGEWRYAVSTNESALDDEGVGFQRSRVEAGKKR